MIPSSAPPPRSSSSPKAGGASKTLFAALAGLTRRQRLLLSLWVAVLVGPSFVMYRVLVVQQRENVRAANETSAALLSTSVAMAGHTQPELTPPPGHEHDVPQVVKVGMYVNRIPAFSILDALWKVEFYIWFSWTGGDADFAPGEDFKMATGEILTRELLKRTDTGDTHYALYRTTAEISKKFDISRFPRDEHLLTISIEDKKRQSYELKFETNPAESEISSRANVPGYSIAGIDATVKPHSYKSSMGDPALPPTYKATYSQFIVGIAIKRGTWGLFAKMFLALYISMLLAVGGLLLASPSERLALGGTALFVAIMNAEANAGLVPATGTATLGDIIDGIGYAAMGLIIAQSIIYHRYVHRDDGPSDVAHVFDLVSIVVIAAAYLTLNLGVLAAAQG